MPLIEGGTGPDPDTHYDTLLAVQRGKPGDFCWLSSNKDSTPQLFIHLPNGAGARILPCGPGSAWTWNGDRERPTLTPSIRPLDNDSNELWHGYLTDGELVEC